MTFNDLRNHTPHAVTIKLSDASFTIQPESGLPPRLVEHKEPAGLSLGIPLERMKLGAVENLPEPAEGRLLIVSALVRLACPERKDLASPGTLLRDAEGKIVGCSSLVVN